MAKRRKKARKPNRETAPRSSPGEEAREAREPFTEPEPRGPRIRAVAYAVIAVAAIAAFGRAVPFALLEGWDDDRFLHDNPIVQAVSGAHFTAIFTQPHFQAYHPLHLLSYWLDVPWVGVENGFAIHAVSLVLFVLALFAVFEASRALKLGILGALTVTLVVGLHPVQVEAVTWATGRKDILALGFSALTVIFHARSSAPFDRWRFLSLLAFAAAALSKTSALPLPLVLALSDVFVFERSWKRALLAQLPLLLVALALGLFTVAIWSDAEMIRGRDLDAIQRVQLVGASLTHHLRTAAWPGSTSPLYPIDRAEIGLFDSLAGFLALGAASYFAFRSKHPHLRLGVAAFVLLFLPVSNVIPLYFQWQDRYLSLPLFALALPAGAFVDAWVSHPKTKAWAPRLALAALALALGARTAQYSGVWRDTETLFGHAAHVHPTSFYAWLNLGHSRARANRLEGALDAYEQAIDVANLATAHDARFRTVVLIDERQLELSPSRADALTSRFHASVTNPEALRGLAGDLAAGGYRRAVMLTLDYSFAQSRVSDEQLEHAAAVQLERGHAWLADYYLSRLSRPPITPSLVDHVRPPEEPQREPEPAEPQPAEPQPDEPQPDEPQPDEPQPDEPQPDEPAPRGGATPP